MSNKQKQYKCICGEEFETRRQLAEHIGIQNPHWPRSSPKDAHKEATTHQ